VAKKQANSTPVVVPIAEPVNDILADRADGERVRICGLAFRFGVRALAARLPWAMPANSLGGTEASILHVLHLNGTPKGLSDVARLLHRDDLANLQYGLKKLLSLGFIDKASNGASRRNTTYLPTESGRAIVDAYLQHRRDTLVRLVGSMSGTQDALQQATSILHVMTGLYDQASTILSSQIGDVPGLRP
jgi:predicted MarR family transcription regulator